jgi:PAS domain S-box-containing protein
MNPKILIVDDEPEILENLETILSDEGFEVVKASSGNEAVANFEAGSFGVVITDMKMPGLSGLDVLRQVKQIDEDIEVIILTGYATLENAILALKDGGAYDYLRKPLEDIKELSFSVRNALEKRRLLIENKKLITELRESERKFRAIFDQTFQFIGLLTIDGKLIEVNRTALDFAGIEEKDALGKPLWETIWWTHSAKLQKRLNEAIRKAADGHFVRFEAFHPAIDGGIHYFDVSIKPVKDEAENVCHLITESRDITERKQVEEKLKDETNQRRNLVEQSRDGIVVLDLNGKVYEANQRYADMLGYSMEEIYQLHVWDWDTRWTKEQLLEMARKVDDTGDHFETRHRRKDGTLCDVEISTSGSVYRGQKLIFCVHRDITDRKRAEKEREKLIKELREALAKVKKLSGMLPICSHCKKIRDDKGYWSRLEAYIQNHSEAEFSHGICPECAITYYPDIDIYGDDD